MMYVLNTVVYLSVPVCQNNNIIMVVDEKAFPPGLVCLLPPKIECIRPRGYPLDIDIGTHATTTLTIHKMIIILNCIGKLSTWFVTPKLCIK
jgi:hypothetical protein